MKTLPTGVSSGFLLLFKPKKPIFPVLGFRHLSYSCRPSGAPGERGGAWKEEEIVLRL